MRLSFNRGLPPPASKEATWALGRRTDFVYLSKSFSFPLQNSRDAGKPARYIWKTFDLVEPKITASDYEEFILKESRAGRVQVKLCVASEPGSVREMWIQKVVTKNNKEELENILHFRREESARFVELMQALDRIPIEGEDSVRIDEDVLRQIFSDASAVDSAYRQNPSGFRQVIAEDASAKDLVALEHRRMQIVRFKRLLEDKEFFNDEKLHHSNKPEKVWQSFLEDNPWILGIGLGGQLLTSWDPRKLETSTTGSSFLGPGKRVDALLKTVGQINSMVFAEIKHHDTPLLASGDYRSGCWPPSAELSGGIVQIQQTVQLATNHAERVADKDSEGAETGNFTYLIRPRSFLIAGNLGQLRGASGVHVEKQRSFELFRRNLYEPEVMTFDELLARAEAQVEAAEVEAG